MYSFSQIEVSAISVSYLHCFKNHGKQFLDQLRKMLHSKVTFVCMELWYLKLKSKISLHVLHFPIYFN